MQDSARRLAGLYFFAANFFLHSAQRFRAAAAIRLLAEALIVRRLFG